MRRKFKNVLTSLLAILVVMSMVACSSGSTSAGSGSKSGQELVGHFTTSRYFTRDAVPEKTVEEILTAGVNTASASNKQPWHFSAVTDKELLQDIESAVNRRREANGQKPLAVQEDGQAVDTNIAKVPLLIVISAEDGAEINAGLATQNMAIMAQLLGYGTKIETSPATAINENLTTFGSRLGIPENQKAKTIIKIGKIDTKINESVDGYTAATTRNGFSEMATIVK